MTSLKQIKANQENAEKSTGPISTEGKEIVARNAIRHGILSTRTYVEDGEQELYREFSERLTRCLNPNGSYESFLVDRIVSTAWRLRRVIHVESLLLRKSHDFLYSDPSCAAFVSNSTSMATLSRYERSLENSLYRTVKELKNFRGEEIEIFGTSIQS